MPRAAIVIETERGLSQMIENRIIILNQQQQHYNSCTPSTTISKFNEEWKAQQLIHATQLCAAGYHGIAEMILKTCQFDQH
jgi:hypothetical protein